MLRIRRAFPYTCMLVLMLIFLALPFTSSAATLEELQAQLAAVLAQIQQMQSSAGGAPTCVGINRTLTLAAKGADVSDLQRFLTTTGDYTFGEVTGYFGAATQEAVRRYQTRNAIVTSGTPQTTGYGAVGPLTRRTLAAGCGAQTSTPAVQSTATPNSLHTPNPNASLDAAIEAALSKFDAMLGNSDTAIQQAADQGADTNTSE